MKITAPILSRLFQDRKLGQEPAELIERVVTYLWAYAEARCVAVALQDTAPPHEVRALSSRGLRGEAKLSMGGFAPHGTGAVRGAWPAELEQRFPEDAIFSVVRLTEGHEQLTLIADAQTEPDALGLVAELLALALERDQALSEAQGLVKVFNGGPVVLLRRRNTPGWPVDKVSANVTREFGWPVEALLGQPGALHLHPEDLQRVEEAVKAALAQGKPSLAQSYRVIDAAGLTREIFEFTHFVRDAAGVVTDLHGYIFDDSERRRSEQEKATRLEQLQQARKIEAIGTLASGIAHDFNNVLAVILSSLELARLQPEVAVADSDLTAATQAALRGRDMVRQLLVFGRSTAATREPKHLQQIVQDALRQVNSILPGGVVLRITLDPTAPPVLADAGQLEQLVINLVTNAVSAMPHGGGLDVTVRSVRGPHDRVELEVKDTGEGMTAEVLSRAFEPFFTTKPIGKGTGLGLAMVHAIARKHGGTVALQSIPGRGTTVLVSLPVAERSESAIPRQRPSLTPKHGEKVAVVDDDPAVAHSTARLIAHFGYQVTSLSSARALLSSFEGHPDAFDLVLTDQSMPEMTGLELGQALRARGVKVPVLLVTGLATEVDPGAIAPPFAVLGKPYRSAELGEALASLLERAPGERAQP